MPFYIRAHSSAWFRALDRKWVKLISQQSIEIERSRVQITMGPLLMIWKTTERPGFYGKKRDETYRQYNEKFGEGNWRIMWEWNGDIIPHIEACHIYEDSYYADSFRREWVWQKLIRKASDVYDHNPSDVKSGLDYTIQNSDSTHLQDIAIRNVLIRRGWKFQGKELIQVRRHEDYWGQKLSPGKLEFHIPELIIVPHIQGWWDYNSVEDFYQSNKILQIN